MLQNDDMTRGPPDTVSAAAMSEAAAGASPGTGSASSSLDAGKIGRYLDVAGVILVHLDGEGTVVWLNRRAAEVLGCEVADTIGVNWFDRFVPEEIREEMRTYHQSDLITRGGAPALFENEILTAAGERRVIAWENIRLDGEGGDPLGTFSSGHDITERRLAESVLRRTNRQLAELKRALDESSIVAITDQRGIITFVNDRFCLISGYRANELIGQDHRILNSGYHSKSFMRELWQTLARGEVWRGDLRNRAKDGRIYWVSTTIVPFLDDQQKAYQYLAIRNDITDRKRIEQELEEMVRRLAEVSDNERRRAQQLKRARDMLIEANRRLLEEQNKVIQAEKLSSIGLLAAGVAHEINNPLSGILGGLKVLEHGDLPDERRHEYFQAILDGLGRIRETVRALLDYSRQQRPRMCDLDLGEIVHASERLLSPVIRSKQVGIAIDVEEGAHAIHGDYTQLMQAIVNVLLNATQASPAGSTIRLSAEPDGHLVALRITDQGPGIPAEDISKVCDPFFTTKPQGEGTGLGLSVTLAIVKNHGGELTFETARGGGTVVTLALPLAEGAEANV